MALLHMDGRASVLLFGSLVMTHSGGKPHEVGDRGQRYEVSVFDEGQNKRIVLGWTNNPESASEMAAGAELRPGWTHAQVKDRQANQ